jgi:hypothetical protein
LPTLSGPYVGPLHIFHYQQSDIYVHLVMVKTITGKGWGEKQFKVVKVENVLVSLSMP